MDDRARSEIAPAHAAGLDDFDFAAEFGFL
jgi:hypothetical protein